MRAECRPPPTKRRAAGDAHSGPTADVIRPHRRPHHRVPKREHGGARRRRGSRERGRPRHAGRARDAGGRQLHGPLRPRPDLPADDPRAMRRDRAEADGRRQPRGAAHAVHGVHRRRPRDHHRHLGRGPRHHHPRRRPTRCRAVGLRAAGPRLSADVGAGRGAHPLRTYRGGLRPGAPGRAGAGRGPGRDPQRGRDHGEAARPGALRRSARVEARDHRGSHQVPDAQREDGRARRRVPSSHRVRGSSGSSPSARGPTTGSTTRWSPERSSRMRRP